MKYVLVQETDNPENTWYYIMDDSLGNVLQIVDMNCNPVEVIPPHEVIDNNPPLPICAQI
jgi:hypothetical protein